MAGPQFVRSVGQEKCEAVFRAAPEAPLKKWAHPRPGRATNKKGWSLQCWKRSDKSHS